MAVKITIKQGLRIVAEGSLDIPEIEVAIKTDMQLMPDPEITMGIEMQFNRAGGPYRMHLSDDPLPTDSTSPVSKDVSITIALTPPDIHALQLISTVASRHADELATLCKAEEDSKHILNLLEKLSSTLFTKLHQTLLKDKE